MKAWEQKAHKVIGELCRESFLQSNRLKDGSMRRKHRPYSVPLLAEELVKCLGEQAEIKAKSIFIQLAISPEWANDPGNR